MSDTAQRAFWLGPSTPENTTAHILDDGAKWAMDALAEEALRIERATREARRRAELVGAWLQVVIDKHPGLEAAQELRRGVVVPIIHKTETVKTAAALRFMKPRRGRA